jgi:EAL domain-containing protein (putative c-di-GMP-specific phosphodiesterase class I)
LGVSLALDNFGTGYTAFNQLATYPIDKLKIDRSFVETMCSKVQKDIIFVDTILSIAKAFNLPVTAEGVETLDQYYALVDKGCNYIEGYLFSEPLTLKELAKGLRTQNQIDLSQDDLKWTK